MRYELGGGGLGDYWEDQQSQSSHPRLLIAVVVHDLPGVGWGITNDSGPAACFTLLMTSS